MNTATPEAEWPIDVALVRRLLEAQHVDLAGLDIEPFASGWDNAMFRLGTDLLVRLPRRRVAATLLTNEQRWLPILAPRLPLPIPTPVRVGTPDAHFPWSWSVVPSFHGASANEEAVDGSEAQRLAEFLRALHAPAPPEAPNNAVRGVPLAERAAVVEERITRLAAATSYITAEVRSAWDAGLGAQHAADATWVHGDLHARNVLVVCGKLSAVIDWGDICRGDCATDLASVWMLLHERRSRERALAAYSPDEALLTRSRAWAVSFGAVLLETGLVDHPAHAAMGARTLRNIGEGP